jgi:hypothetical protein
MALFLSMFNIIGLLLGWAIIIGWEVWQAGSGTGTPEVMDILFGIVPFTAVWCLLFFSNRRWKYIKKGTFGAMVRALRRRN